MGGAGANESRRFERFPFIEDAIVDGTRHCTVNDISEGGLYVSSIQVFEKDSVIDITIPFKGDKLTLRGKVQYCQPGIGAGVMFTDLNDEKRARIKELIEKLGNR